MRFSWLPCLVHVLSIPENYVNFCWHLQDASTDCSVMSGVHRRIFRGDRHWEYENQTKWFVKHLKGIGGLLHYVKNAFQACYDIGKEFQWFVDQISENYPWSNCDIKSSHVRNMFVSRRQGERGKYKWSVLGLLPANKERSCWQTEKGLVKVKVKLSLCLTWAPRHEGVLGSGGIAPRILDLGTRWR
jgi:hypothetical protein